MQFQRASFKKKKRKNYSNNLLLNLTLNSGTAAVKRSNIILPSPENISICFDPDDLNTLIEDDINIIRQYYEFSEILDDCLENKQADDKQKSKWIIRMQMNESEMLDKNITMEDVHIALKNAYQDTVLCLYSYYNSNNLFLISYFLVLTLNIVMII